MTAPRVLQHEISIDQVEWLGRLGRGCHGDTWFARVGGSEVCVAKRVLCNGEEAQLRLKRRIARIAGCADEALVHVIGVAMDADAVTMVRALDPGTSLGRLVSVGSLAAGQVAALAEGMLTGLAALHSRRLVHGAIHPGNVFLDPDGSVRLSDAGLALHVYPRTQRRGDLEAVTALLLEIWEPSRRLAHPALTFLLEHDALTQASDAAGALQALHDVWPETERTAGRAGLGEFALRIAGSGPPSPHLSSVRDARPRASLRIPDMPDDTGEPSQTMAVPLPRSRPWVSAQRLGAAVATVAVVAIVTSLVVLTHHAPVANPHPGAGRTARLPPAHISPTPAKPSTGKSVPGAAVLEPPAPPTLGYLESAVLTLSPTSCRPGSACTLMSRIDLGPHPLGTVAWQVVAIDRCSGAQSVLASASGVDDVNDQYMWQNVTITLPSAAPMALYVVSVSPVRVASPAVDVPPGPTECARPDT